jgi:phage-related holin
MKTLFTVLNSKPLLLSAITVAGLELAFLPKPVLLYLLMGAMFIDLVTGLVKSWQRGVATASAGFQRTVIKMSRYTAVIFGVWIAANVICNTSGAKADYSPAINGTVGFLSFIEIYSIFENVYEIDPTGPLSKWFIGPALKLLRGRLINNPLNKFPGNDDESK